MRDIWDSEAKQVAMACELAKYMFDEGIMRDFTGTHLNGCERCRLNKHTWIFKQEICSRTRLENKLGTNQGRGEQKQNKVLTLKAELSLDAD